MLLESSESAMVSQPSALGDNADGDEGVAEGGREGQGNVRGGGNRGPCRPP